MTNKFSVAMCTYNGGRYLKEQLDSFTAQTRLPDELVVCDDGSSDETCQIVSTFAASAPFLVRLEVNQQTLGSTQNFAKAIQLCRGDLIALCDQDDVWLPGKLDKIERLFAARPATGLVFTDAELVDEHLNPLGHRLWGQVGFDRKARELVNGGRALDLLLPGWTVTGATMAFRSRYLSLVLDIPNDLPMIHDGWIALVVAAVSDISFIDEPLIKYRQHGNQQIGARAKTPADEPQKGFAAVRDAISRRNAYWELIQIGEQVRRRLLERNEVFDSRSALVQLDARLTHLRGRAQMPEGRLSRLPTIARELLSRRYSRFSNGFYSAIKDFLR